MRWIVAAAALALASSACASSDESKAVSAMKDAMAAAQANDLDGAKAAATKAVELRPGFIDPLMMLAAIAEDRADWEEARRRYLEVLKYDPTDTAAGIALGVTFVRESRFDDAREWFRRAIASDPGAEAAAYNLGSVAEQQNDLETAAAWFDVASALDRRDPRALTRIGEIRLAQNRADEALDAADAALRRWPQSQSASNLRARALRALGRSE